jgi:hypothetical protein
MKNKSLGVTVLLVAFAGSALAQNHISATGGKCDKPDTSQSIEVGDHAGHMLVLSKVSSCTWSVPFEMAGLKSSTYTTAVAVDATGPKYQDRGYGVMTMENGDKAYSRIQGTGQVVKEGDVNEEATWSFTGGTGKLKGLKGKGTYRVSAAGGMQVEGDYSLRGAGATAKK